MIKRLAFIYLLPIFILAAYLCRSETFTDKADYSTETFQLNSTSYTEVISNTSGSDSKRIPWNGISIINTNAATTVTVHIVWSNGAGATNEILKVICIGLSTNYIPESFLLWTTNENIKMKMDNILSNALHIKTYFLLTGTF